ncbi:hypothetical protein [Candidatus Xianfuyuplasma coldseepsis]|uniref:DUF1304 domain-containing protein n=1 Tax=Candidatus Xianfuyuplasma coldseepsis TaxID=2782163 RepID=A0A7L7KSE4_9MOLU|nr:hypothetical protein [Xianfuyuplasma coldseepsis]QMS85740.1 hypothetical protein G4Z02_08285 [Xianfuyuplasma coldseepsis]
MILSIIGASLTILWGISHLFPTKSVVKDFGDISEDNKNIVYMEWINEGVTLISLGALVILSIIITGNVVSYLNIFVIIVLAVLAIISLFTGFRINFIPFKLCPVIFTVSAVLLLLGIFV